MVKRSIYLDHASATPVDPRVLKVMLPYFTHWYANPASLYSIARKVKTDVEKARSVVAGSINARPEEIIFTAGGTEANNLALFGVAQALRNRGNHVITSQIEHQSILSPCKVLEKQGFKVTYIGVDQFGLVNPKEIERAITPETILVSIMLANNEIGTIQPLTDIGKITRRHKVYFHTDASQCLGLLPVDVQGLKLDLLTLNSGKIYGPKGVGALYVRRGTQIRPSILGGSQEMGLRAGTSNVPGIIGFAKACELATKDQEKEQKRLSNLRDKLITEILKIPGSRLNGHATERLANNINVSFSGIESEALLFYLDTSGIYASAGSACHTSTISPSHVLLAIGLSPELAQGSLRFTLGRSTKSQDIAYVSQVLSTTIDKLRSVSQER
ncbi:MAG: cysteine desulfurase NifS [Candidatus Abawacabacteria bacterium RBG_16_42_10]|uniref:Cysteine desulfurase NifS n=1 Tax=Candidatus Abawacabacteria bacterium RBG_16_42_10 TaxID=1817814 RepID=A0A1F4XM36_9BACT|nr:MAG: cysteine desulfurase NifS [Candidatus Abawacabacteria bacterium RBG_16_42_10]